MPLDTRSFENSRQSAWPWRAGIVVSNPELAAEIADALAEVRATCVFQIGASGSALEVFALVERDQPDLLFVELSATSVNINADPAQMISALRAGATEFLSLPLNPAILGALDRIATRLDTSPPTEAAQGEIIGIVSAKGGCGGTTHLNPQHRAAEMFDSVQKLSSSNWSEFFTPLAPSVDVMAGPEPCNAILPEPWSIESLFRHLTRSYPIVLALSQTRYILQTLTSRGFERSRICLILTMSENTPRDFWIESVEQMFEMRLFGVIPTDRAAMSGLPKDNLVFPAETSFGKAVKKLAARMSADESAGPSRRAA